MSHMETTPGGERQPAIIPTAPGDCVDERVDAAHVEGIDEQAHGLDCACGCRGDALVIKEQGRDGAWIASSMDAERYVQQRIESVVFRG